MVHQSRTSGRDRLGNSQPRFKYISEWHAVVYDPSTMNTYSGNWNDYHAWIARDQGISKPEDSWNGIQRYISADSFRLRAIHEANILAVDTIFSLRPVDFAVLEARGYTLMSPDRGWLVLDQAGQGTFKTIPSAISR